MRIINHIAQNVPVCTAKDYADEVVNFCRGEAKLTQYSFLKQDNTKKELTEYDKTPLSQLKTLSTQAYYQHKPLPKAQPQRTDKIQKRVSHPGNGKQSVSKRIRKADQV